MEFTVERKVPASAAELRVILDEIIAELRDGRFPCGDLDEIKLAIQEALANAFRHGSPEHEDQLIVVQAHWNDREGLHIIVNDEGPGFDPAVIPDPTTPENLEKEGGRGLFLMQELMDEVEFRRGGREVHLRRKPRPPGDSD